MLACDGLQRHAAGAHGALLYVQLATHFSPAPHTLAYPTLFHTLTCPHFRPLLLRRDIVKSALEARRRQDRSLDEAAAAITASR